MPLSAEEIKDLSVDLLNSMHTDILLNIDDALSILVTSVGFLLGQGPKNSPSMLQVKSSITDFITNRINHESDIKTIFHLSIERNDDDDDSVAVVHSFPGKSNRTDKQ